ncbi:hypothetical protein JTE90_013908 [Oedothorax gibbosus]|uniref:Uncharacterized protein n=1 Tax=Oedothorax gibbosus TaxID=931172 RepID=A0AAV6UD53_9ARAC|nr:hypothetical protein JTE90_013908 [Oedothorax gibbosus]
MQPKSSPQGRNTSLERWPAGIKQKILLLLVHRSFSSSSKTDKIRSWVISGDSSFRRRKMSPWYFSKWVEERERAGVGINGGLIYLNSFL